MKRKLTFCILGTLLVSGAFSCWIVAQEPARAPSSIASPAQAQRYRNNIAQNMNQDDGRNREIAELIAKYQATDSETSKKDLTAQISKLVMDQFDARQDAKQKELNSLEEQLTKLKELHSKRARLKDNIVADRVQQLIREADGLGWGSSESSQSWLSTSYYPQQFGSYPASGFGTTYSSAGNSPALLAPAAGLAPLGGQNPLATSGQTTNGLTTSSANTTFPQTTAPVSDSTSNPKTR